MLLLSGVVENGYMVPILAILGPMANLFIRPQVSFDLLQAISDLPSLGLFQPSKGH